MPLFKNISAGATLATMSSQNKETICFRMWIKPDCWITRYLPYFCYAMHYISVMVMEMVKYCLSTTVCLN